jgi:cell division septation protein DedD
MAPAAKGAIMVQLMAASQLEDAQVLAGALNKRGYNAVVRSEPDRLFHVQVGPFATHAEADAMRRKLQGDGYNAILK